MKSFYPLNIFNLNHMRIEIIKIAVISLISALAGIIINTNSSLIQSVVSVPMIGWLIYQVRDPEKIWDSFSNIKRPTLFTLNSYFISFVYLSWKGLNTDKTLYLSLGICILAGVFSTLMSKYWYIGDI